MGSECEWKMSKIKLKINHIIGLLLIFPVALNIYMYVPKNTQTSTDLSGDWEYCQPLISNNMNVCEWQHIRFPSPVISITHKSENINAKKHYLKKKFKTPEYCLKKTCYFTISFSGGSLIAEINSNKLDEVKKDTSTESGSSVYAAQLTLGDYLRKDGSDNELILNIDSLIAGALTVGRGPIIISTKKTSEAAVELAALEVVVVPLAGAAIVFVVFLFLVVFGGLSKIITPSDRSNINLLIITAIVSVLYMISLSRIPRKIFDYNFTYAVHWLLMAFRDVLLFLLFAKITNIKFQINNILKLIVSVPALCSVVVVVLVLVNSDIQPFSNVNYRVALKTFTLAWFVPYFVWLFNCHKIQHSFLKTRLLAFAFVIFQLNDALSYNGAILEFYYVRFTHPLIIVLLAIAVIEECIVKIVADEVEILYSKRFSRLSHDLKAPIAALRSLAEQIRDVSSEERKLLTMSVNRINEITNDSNKLHHLRADTESVIAVIKKVISQVLVVYPKSQIQEKICIHEDVTVGLNNEELASIIRTLLNNACESTNNVDAEIEVEVSQIAKTLLIKIADNGSGIQQDCFDKIFTKGFSLGKKNGSGLGLYYAKKLVDGADGVIEFKANKNVGTVFTIKLPAKKRF